MNDTAFDRINITAAEADHARRVRAQAQEAFISTYRQLVWALDQEVAALANEAAANGVPATKFIAACVTNARNKAATWSGGAHSKDNVIEALTREAWLNIADDAATPSIFNKDAK